MHADMQIAQFAAGQEQDAADNAAEQRLFDDECTKIRTEHPGDKLAVFGRGAFAAINEFGDAELKQKVKDADMYANATDLSKWREIGVPLATLRLMHNISLKAGDAGNFGGGGGGGDGDSIKAKAAKLYPRTKQ